MSTAPAKPRTIDFEEIRRKLSDRKGREFWRSLDELAETEEFQEYVRREFPDNFQEWSDPVGRRRFLKLMGASFALAGVTACTKQPAETIIPYVRQPAEIVPGKPLYFATAADTQGGRLIGILAESHMGRPTKLEGNELHPASLGRTDLRTQAEILSLYDPDRAQVVTNAGQIRTWETFSAACGRALEEQLAKGGAGLRILTETVVSPTLHDQLRSIERRFPQCRIHQYEPINFDNLYAGTRMAFGRELDVRLRFDQARVVVSLDADFLFGGAAPVRYARDFMSGRAVGEGRRTMNRLYAAESAFTNTGSCADHRLPVRASVIEGLARRLARQVGVEASEGSLQEAERAWIDRAAADLLANPGAGVVVVGDHQLPVVHALAAAVNHRLANVGSTVEFTDPVEARPVDQSASLKSLVEAMQAGDVEFLLILGGNPVYNSPSDHSFSEAMAKVSLRIHWGLYEDETSAFCHWHIPATHFLESWSDGRAYDGTVTVRQPLIAPLYQGRSAHELLNQVAGQPGQSAYEIVRGYWESHTFPGLFPSFWRQTVHDGVAADSSFSAVDVPQPNLDFPPPSPAAQGLEVVFQPDPTIYDGRHANNGWLQETPKQLSKLTWDNAALVGPRTAERMSLDSSDLVELRLDGRSVEAPLWIVPGLAEGVVSISLGYGRTAAGQVGNGLGFNAYAVRTSDRPGFAAGLELRRLGRRAKLATVQEHFSLEGRNHVRAATLKEFLEHPDFAREMGEAPDRDMTLYPPHEYAGHAWAMSINLNACTGCNACVVACQAENNIPVVGKEQVLRGREMQWIRVDRYFQGDLDSPAVHHQPVPCMQCENAPCEPVCPVGATVHSSEGLNDMVYNRCVGTRYCANNCPYKVRRFNFYLFADWETPSKKLAYNPDVTLRSRGVMEKCTYCVQRISLARIEAKREDRTLRDGDIQTACQQVCPTDAIVFGDLNDPESQVVKRKSEPLDYAMLAELGTRPRTTYLAKVTNPHPETESE